MSVNIGGITSKVIEFALDGLSLRHEAIASNIANLNSSGYRPVSVSFEDKISELLTAENQDKSSFKSNDYLMPKISYGSPVDHSLSNTRLDMSTVMLNQNVLQYHALIKGLDKYISNIALATNDGRR